MRRCGKVLGTKMVPIFAIKTAMDSCSLTVYIYICMSVEAGKFRLGCPVLRINGCPNPFTPIFLIGEIGYVPYKSVEICRKNQLANNKGSVNRSFPRRPNTLGL